MEQSDLIMIWIFIRVREFWKEWPHDGHQHNPYNTAYTNTTVFAKALASIHIINHIHLDNIDNSIAESEL